MDHFPLTFFGSIDPHNVILAMRNLRTCMRSSPAARGSSLFHTPCVHPRSPRPIALLKKQPYQECFQPKPDDSTGPIYTESSVSPALEAVGSRSKGETKAFRRRVKTFSEAAFHQDSLVCSARTSWFPFKTGIICSCRYPSMRFSTSWDSEPIATGLNAPHL